MEKVTISEIRNRFSAYLKKVRSGEVIVILDRNRPVARLEGISSSENSDDALIRLESEGLICRSVKPVPFDLLRSEPPLSNRSVLEALLEERREDR